MKLSAYLRQEKMKAAAFGRLIGVTRSAALRYANGSRIPEPDIMQRIAHETGGSVQANDFYAVVNCCRSGDSNQGESQAEVAPDEKATAA